MNSQTYNQLNVEGDPTTWVLKNPINDGELQRSEKTFVAAVISPRAGTLLLSCRAVASVLLGNSPSAGYPAGPIWSDDSPLPRSWLYLPTDAGLTPNSRGYALPASINLTDLQNEITTAMTERTFATILVSVGAAVLNGARLSFAAILPQ